MSFDIYGEKNAIEFIKKLKQLQIPAAEYKSYFDSFIEMKARQRGIPITGCFELTPFCNLDCKMCYIHLDNSQYDRGKLLPVDTWKNLIEQAYQAGMRRASLTGGECLTYPGFDEVYLFLHRLGIAPAILTNGILIDDERISFFKNTPPRSIMITVYGSSDDAYEKVTGHRVFHTVYHNIVRLNEEKLPIYLSVTPNAFMKDDIFPLIELLHRMDIPYQINSNLIQPRENTGRIAQDLSIDEYVEIFKYKNKLDRRTTTPVDPVELPEESRIASNRYGIRCGAGRSSFTIKYDGTMSPCASLDEVTTQPLAVGFLDAWKELNSEASIYPVPAECGDCVYLNRCHHCVAMHKNAPRFGHCDPRICERTKKFVAAGFISIPSEESQ